MNKYEVLECIKTIWNDENVSLGDKIKDISMNYYSVGLDTLTASTYINATNIELESLLALSFLEEKTIQKISEINPPKTTWIMLANANEDEINQALLAMDIEQKCQRPRNKDITISKFVYDNMKHIAGLSVEEKLCAISRDDLCYFAKKGEAYNGITKKESNFLKSIAAQKNAGKMFSEKQVSWLNSILRKLITVGAISKKSVDGDQDRCNRILEIFGE